MDERLKASVKGETRGVVKQFARGVPIDYERATFDMRARERHADLHGYRALFLRYFARVYEIISYPPPFFIFIRSRGVGVTTLRARPCATPSCHRQE